jgi:hypothetical protein
MRLKLGQHLPHNQPCGGGVREIVPAPSGIRAVGDGDAAERPLLERTTVSWTGVGGAGETGREDAIGDTGFICSPLKTEGCKRTGWGDAAGVVAAGVAAGIAAGTGIAGEEERTFSRCACKYALLLREGVSGKAGTRAGLGLVGVRAFCEKGEKVLGWRSSSLGEGT